MPVIIDGHNLLWAVKSIEDAHSISDAALCKVLDDYFGLTKQKAEIIFDGTGPANKTGFAAIINIDINFSGRNCDCDTLMEQRICASTAPRCLTVVSSDRRLRDAAGARKARAVKCEDFWDDVKKRLTKYKPVKEPSGKRKGLTEGETQLWLKIFGLEP